MKQLSRILSHKIAILKFDQQKAIWQCYKFCYAGIEDLYLNSYQIFENLDFGSIISKNHKIFRIRYRKELRLEHRIKFKNHYYTILKLINENEQNKVHRILGSQI